MKQKGNQIRQTQKEAVKWTARMGKCTARWCVCVCVCVCVCSGLQVFTMCSRAACLSLSSQSKRWEVRWTVDETWILFICPDFSFQPQQDNKSYWMLVVNWSLVQSMINSDVLWCIQTKSNTSNQLLKCLGWVRNTFLFSKDKLTVTAKSKKYQFPQKYEPTQLFSILIISIKSAY